VTLDLSGSKASCLDKRNYDGWKEAMQAIFGR
jgi:hypothetical protein